MKLALAIFIGLFAMLSIAQDIEPSILEEWQNMPGSVFEGATCVHDKDTRFTGILQPASERHGSFGENENDFELNKYKSKFQVLDDLTTHFANRRGQVYRLAMNPDVALEALLHPPVAGLSNSSANHEEGEQDRRDRAPRLRNNDDGDDDNDDDEESDEDKRRIFSPDNRFRLTPTTYAPSKYVVKLSIGCSGMIIGPRHIITAGHCVHSGGSNGDWMWSDWVAPAKDGATEPYGRFRPVWMVSVTGWTVNRDYDYDYALIRVDRDFSTGGLYGWERFGFNLGLGSSTTVYLRGYPGDKGGQTMWWTSGRLSGHTTSRRLYSNIYDTTGGSSGSGVYSYWVPSGETSTARIVHATHSGWNDVCVTSFLGICFDYEPFNRATRITPSNFPLYCSWTGLC